jgi:hypothetical protein
MMQGAKRQTFYEVYVSVIYGFVTVTGLEAFLDPVQLNAVGSQQWLLFAGSLITASELGERRIADRETGDIPKDFGNGV